MKVNEAPEKIYLYPSDRAGEDYEDEWGTMPWGEDYVEYTRTDTFIEKACEWIKESITNNSECNRIISKKGVITMGLLIEDFKNYMKGE